MDKTHYIDNYDQQYDKLINIVENANRRVISETPDLFFYENTNFFTKSFLVIMCAYLESYLKDSLMVIVDEINNRLLTNKLPHNLIKWSFNIEKDLKDNELKFEEFKISIRKKELDDFISGNPFRTKELFKKFGIQLDKNDNFNSLKDKVNTIVNKRNNVLHHNDEASDLSNQDIIDNILILKEYIKVIDKVICNHIS